MATKTQTIKINKDRHGPTLRGGINGRMFAIPTGVDYEAEEALVEHLRNSGVSFEEVASEGGKSKEGSGDLPPEDTKPHMLPQSLDDTGGDQPGDVTTGSGAGGGKEATATFAEDAEISDVRVAAERRTPIDSSRVSPAELAGEGEQGTPKPKPLSSASRTGTTRKGK